MSALLQPARVCTLALLLILLAGCGTSSAQGSNSTPMPAASCTDLPGLDRAVPATTSLSPDFADVPLPPHSWSTPLTASAGGVGQYTLLEFDVCTSSTSGSSVANFYNATVFPGYGWSGSANFPYDGAYLEACGSPLCWSKDNESRYLTIEQLTDRPQERVTYHFRLAKAPPLPTCTPLSQFPGTFSGRYIAKYDFGSADSIPLPPWSDTAFNERRPPDGSGATRFDAELCSAGNSVSIDAFLTKTLGRLGWTPGTLPDSIAAACGTPFTGYVKGTNGVKWETTSDSSVWLLHVCRG